MVVCDTANSRAGVGIPGRSIVLAIAVGGTPHFIITGLYPPANLAIPTPTPQQGAASSSGNTFNPLPLLVVTTGVAGLLLTGTLWLLWKHPWRRPAGR